MATLSEIRLKWQLPAPNAVRKVTIPNGMLKGTYEISLGELTDTSGNILTPLFIRKEYDPNHKFELRDFSRLFHSDSDVRGSGIEFGQYQHLMPVWQNPDIDHVLYDSLKGRRVYLDSASVRQEDRYFMGRAYVAENGELSIDLSRPYAETAFSDGLVNELCEDTLWKPIVGRKIVKATKPTYLRNVRDEDVPNRFVDAYFGSIGLVYADAGWLPLGGGFYWGARSVKKVE